MRERGGDEGRRLPGDGVWLSVLVVFRRRTAAPLQVRRMPLPHTTNIDHVVATPHPPAAAISRPLLWRLHLRHSRGPGGVANLAAVADNIGQLRRGWYAANKIRNRDSPGHGGATGAAVSAADARRRARGEYSSVSAPARTAVLSSPRTPVHNGRDSDATVRTARPPPKPRPLPSPPPPRRAATRSRGCCRHCHPYATTVAACTAAFRLCYQAWGPPAPLFLGLWSRQCAPSGAARVCNAASPPRGLALHPTTPVSAPALWSAPSPWVTPCPLDEPSPLEHPPPPPGTLPTQWVAFRRPPPPPLSPPPSLTRAAAAVVARQSAPPLCT